MKLKTTLLGKTYTFASIKEVLAKANEEKTGDKLAGLAAENWKREMCLRSGPFPVRRRICRTERFPIRSGGNAKTWSGSCWDRRKTASQKQALPHF